MTTPPPTAHRPVYRPVAADRWLAATLGVIGLVLGLGGADEFRYFGPDTTQFWAGVVAVAAGAIAVLATVRLWGRGSGAAATTTWVRVAAGALFIATLVGTLLRVMGPPAILLGLLGVAASVWWSWHYRAAT